MTESGPLLNAILFLLAAVVAVPLVQRLKVSPVLGYLLAGLAVGPHAAGLIADSDSVHALGDFGVVFLLFAIGLELSLERLKVMRRLVFGLGLAQMVLAAVPIGAIAYGAGLDLRAALVVGVALAMSSTAIVVQLLSERNEVAGQAGRAAVAVLLLQDLFVVPMLVLIPLLGNNDATLLDALALSTAKAVAALSAIVAFAPMVLRPVLRFVARERNAELFAAVTLLAVLGTAWLTGAAGLSLPLGAFLAGLILADTEFRHQVAAEIQSFRGLLLGLFFITVGMTVDLGVLAQHAPQVIVGVVGLLLLKSLTLAGAGWLAGFRAGTAARVGLLLSEGGEFAFVLTALASAAGVLPREAAQFLAVVVALSMVLTPGLAYLGRLVERRADSSNADPVKLAAETRDLAGHVLILGFGRVGRAVAGMLERAGVPNMALDHDHASVQRAHAIGRPVYFGSADRPELLRACRLDTARGVVVTLDHAGMSERAVQLIRGMTPGLPVIARGRDHGHAALLKSLGATDVVIELAEASLALGGKALALVGEPAEAIDAAVKAARGSGDALTAR